MIVDKQVCPKTSCCHLRAKYQSRLCFHQFLDGQASEILNDRTFNRATPCPPAKKARATLESAPQLNAHRATLSFPVAHRRAAGSLA
jgi:hypothetical protein